MNGLKVADLSSFENQSYLDQGLSDSDRVNAARRFYWAISKQSESIEPEKYQQILKKAIDSITQSPQDKLSREIMRQLFRACKVEGPLTENKKSLYNHLESLIFEKELQNDLRLKLIHYLPKIEGWKIPQGINVDEMIAELVNDSLCLEEREIYFLSLVNLYSYEQIIKLLPLNVDQPPSVDDLLKLPSAERLEKFQEIGERMKDALTLCSCSLKKDVTRLDQEL